MTGFNIESSLISVAIGVVIPGLVALVSREHASAALKAFLSALLTAVSGGLTGALAALPHGWHDWQAILWSIFVAWVAAAVSYFTGWKPSGASDRIAHKTANFGVGPRSAPPAAGNHFAGNVIGDAGYARVALFVAALAAGALAALIVPLAQRELVAVILCGAGLLIVAGVYYVELRTLQTGWRNRREHSPSKRQGPPAAVSNTPAWVRLAGDRSP